VRISLLGIIASLLVASGLAWSKDPKPVVYKNTAPGVAYTGSESCAASVCHADLTDSYRLTPMGNSMAPANAPSELSKVPGRITIYNKELDRHFEVVRVGSDLYQTEYQLDENGNRVFTTTQKLEYVTGGPLTAYTYIVRMGQNLFEAPLTYYNKTHQWDLSPGYNAKDVAFNRPIPPRCLACHNGQPEPVPNREGMYRDPPFRYMEYGIGCECCHGPGQLHVAMLATHPKRKYGKVDPTIVNPARLSARLANDLCMNCHQGGVTYILQPGRTVLDFRPGTPLYETLALFKLPITQDQRAELNRLETLPPVRGSIVAPMWWKNLNLEMSRCFHDSNGELRCITCHVIHHPPTPENKVAYYREKCITCHNNDSCKLSLAERTRQEPANNCVGCHMPRKPTAGIPHSDDTNHRIVRQAGQPYPDYAFDAPTPDLPGLVCLNRRGEDATRPIPPLTKLQAYAQASLKDRSLSRYYYDLLEQLRMSMPNDPMVLACLGRKAIADKEEAKAVEYLTRALQTGADYAATYIDLGEALARLGRIEESAKVLERGVAAWPFSADIQKALVLRYVTLKQFPQADEALKRYVALFPEDTYMRAVMATVEARNP
jgi:tetratricopeptide repeat protein/cytochrome c554/c'-like protein